VSDPPRRPRAPTIFLRTRHKLEPLTVHWSHWPGRSVIRGPGQVQCLQHLRVVHLLRSTGHAIRARDLWSRRGHLQSSQHSCMGLVRNPGRMSRVCMLLDRKSPPIFLPVGRLAGANASPRRFKGYLAHKKMPSPRTLDLGPYDSPQGEAFFQGRGTPVAGRVTLPGRSKELSCRTSSSVHLSWELRQPTGVPRS
jgi:hypothetical protein